MSCLYGSLKSQTVNKCGKQLLNIQSVCHLYCFRGWTRLQPIRTVAEIPVQIKISPVQQIPLYQKFAQKAKELHLLGITYKEIAECLNIGVKT